MFVDELTIHARAGRGGDGVVRWLRLRHKALGGPAGGNGGKGGDVYIHAVRDVGLLSKYTGVKEFAAEDGSHGQSRSKHGNNGQDYTIDLPVGATVTHQTTGRTWVLETEGQRECILKGGNGGFGNEHFKSSTHRSPKERTVGKSGGSGSFYIELELSVDVGLIGEPNAGKSTLINMLTNTTSRVGAYPFTTLEPQLGSLFGFVIADIPGLITGASGGRGLGHKFLRHIRRTKMLLHLVSLEHEDPYKTYRTIREELALFDQTLLEKEEWVVLTKKDLVDDEKSKSTEEAFAKEGKEVYVVSQHDETSLKFLRDELVLVLRNRV